MAASSSSAGPLKLAHRIGVPAYETDAAFGQLLDALTRYRSAVDEVSLFDSLTHHLYIPLPDYARRAEIMGRRIQALKAAGIPSVGINVLTTIGHMNEAWSTMPPLPFQPMVGHDGAVSTGCACPNTPEMRQYVRAKYELAAKAGPGFIWVDDDIRMHHHGVAWGCFCPTCLAIFARSAGRRFSREEMVAALNRPEEGGLRRQWVEQNIATIESLLAEVERTIHAADPAIATGLMTAGPGWTTYSGLAFDRWFRALKATKARPGGGFYSDETPWGMYHKAIDIGRQRAVTPAEVGDLQYELENFPYQALKKATGTVIRECTLALAYGLNGIAFNALGDRAYDVYLPILKQAALVRPCWERLVRHAAGLPTAGVWVAWSPGLTARRQVRQGENWLGYDRRYDINRPTVLAEIGLPLSVDPAGCPVVLSGRVPDAFDENQLRTMLAGGVLMDSEAALALAERGLGELTGVRVARRLDNGMVERFTDDPLNGPDAASLRDARIEFWGDATGLADVLEPLNGKVHILATMEDYFQRPAGPCMTSYENALGGRVVVAGYAQWMFIHSTAKRRQLLNVADWISRDGLPVRVEEAVGLAPIVRLSPDRRRGLIVLLNRSLDPVQRTTVHVRAPHTPVTLVTEDEARGLRPQTQPDGWLVVLEDIGPWTVTTLLLG